MRDLSTSKPFEWSDFDTKDLKSKYAMVTKDFNGNPVYLDPTILMQYTIAMLNRLRDEYLDAKQELGRLRLSSPKYEGAKIALETKMANIEKIVEAILPQSYIEGDKDN